MVNILNTVKDQSDWPRDFDFRVEVAEQKEIIKQGDEKLVLSENGPEIMNRLAETSE